jgi:signal peptidase I
MRYFSLSPTTTSKRIVFWGWAVWVVLRFASTYNVLTNVLQIFCVLVGLHVFYTYRVSVREKQKALNSLLSESEPQGSYFLYLRPFISSRAYPVKNNLRGWADRLLCGSKWDVETALSFALQRHSPLFAIGETKSSIGAIKLFTPDDLWKQKFEKLCDGAQLIFLLPLSSPSTIWEIKEIASRDDWRSKAVFVIPPTFLLRQYLRYLFATSPQAAWTQASRELINSGIHLPKYNRKGRLFTLGPDKRVEHSQPLSLLETTHVDELVAYRGRIERDVKESKPVWFDRRPWRWTVFSPNFGYLVAICLLFASLVRAFFQPYHIPGASMNPTLLVGDYISVNSSAFGFDLTHDLPFANLVGMHSVLKAQPGRGEVVLFRLPENEEEIWVNRIIGIPGDRVQMRDGRLNINGEPVARERISDFVDEQPCGFESPVKRWKEILPSGVAYETLDCIDNGFYDNTPEYVVPRASYFMLGDNRDNSVDSRVMKAVGYVPSANIIARASFIYFSVREGAHANFGQWLRTVRWNRLFKGVQ